MEKPEKLGGRYGLQNVVFWMGKFIDTESRSYQELEKKGIIV